MDGQLSSATPTTSSNKPSPCCAWIGPPSWDEEDGHNNNVRLRGKLQLPGLSKRLNLVFSDDSGDELTDDEQRRNGRRRRLVVRGCRKQTLAVDLHLGINWDELRPGVRYRNQGTIGRAATATGSPSACSTKTTRASTPPARSNLDRALSENSIVRWSNRGFTARRPRVRNGAPGCPCSSAPKHSNARHRPGGQLLRRRQRGHRSRPTPRTTAWACCSAARSTAIPVRGGGARLQLPQENAETTAIRLECVLIALERIQDRSWKRDHDYAGESAATTVKPVGFRLTYRFSSANAANLERTMPFTCMMPAWGYACSSPPGRSAPRSAARCTCCRSGPGCPAPRSWNLPPPG